MNHTQGTFTRARLSGILAGLLGAGALTGQAAGPYYVATNGPGGDFKSWEQASSNIQWAVDAAQDGETVWVSNGVYVLTNQVVVTNAITLISASGPDSTRLDGGFVEGSPATNNRCLFISNAAALVSGFTISNGAVILEDGGGVYMYDGVLSNCVVRNNTVFAPVAGSLRGGGLYAYYGTVTACRVINNLVTNFANTTSYSGSGGGIAIISSAALMSDCIVSNNRIMGGYASTAVGAGIFSEASTIRSTLICDNVNQRGWAGGIRMNSGLLDSCTVTVNRAMSYGGGCMLQTGIITNCLIACNSATVAGGGVYTRYTANNRYASIVNSTLTGNTNGGALLSASQATFTGSRNLVKNCVISDNTAYGVAMSFTNDSVFDCDVRGNRGLGIRCSNGKIRNCLIAGNASNGVLVSSSCQTALVSACTIAGNLSDDEGAGLRIEATNAALLEISSCVIAGNGASGTNDACDAAAPANAGALRYCCVGDGAGFTAPSLLVADPQFKDAAGGNYRLRFGSPCINAGANESWMEDEDALDLDGGPRIRYDTVDMGAYEVLKIMGSIIHVR